MIRLSSPLTQLKHHYDVLVVGSGYGGSIAASRMARAGKTVCMFERGAEKQPGEYADTLWKSKDEMQVDSKIGHVGSKTAMLDFHVNDDVSVLRGCGLGGTSLINANVSIAPEERVFTGEGWPKEIRENPKSLVKSMDDAREMLGANQYPEGTPGFPVLNKTNAQRESAKELGGKFDLLDINVTFKDGVNKVGVPQKACNLCGDCVTGCNHHAKNTTLMNYIPDAKNHGAEIYCEVEVSHVERGDGHWIVHFSLPTANRDKFDAPILSVTATKVFLGAGSLGSSQILLKSKEQGLSLSDEVGNKFTGNGDVLAFGYNNDRPIDGVGWGDKYKEPGMAPVGPCITSVVDMRDTEDMSQAMILEEGSIPGTISSVLTPAFIPISRLIGKDTDSGFIDFIKEKGREIASMVKGAYTGAIKNSQIYLMMAHDNGNGKMKLGKKGRLEIDWPGVGSDSIFTTINDRIKGATKALGGTFIKNPVWTSLFDFDLVTVHPLGGCNMADSAETGVTDHKGQVFSGATGTDMHPDLYVTDGAFVPRSVGCNPLLTISALAERACDKILEEEGITTDRAFRKVDAYVDAELTAGVQFTEKMTGFFSESEKGDFEKGYEAGESENSVLEFVLTVVTEDVHNFVKDKTHTGNMYGTVIAPKLSAHPITVSDTTFNLFIKDAKDPSHKNMNYKMVLKTKEGKTFYFDGFKDVHDDGGFDLWKDTTELFTTIYEGSDDTGVLVGKGKLVIKAADFARQLTTMKAINVESHVEKAKAVMSFGVLFAGDLWDTYIADKFRS